MNSDVQQRMFGYVTVRQFSGMAIPVPVQNMLLRNYATNLQCAYVLPKNEHKYENCYMQLFETIRLAPHGAHLVMCSIFMLPNQVSLYRNVCDEVQQKNITIHCLLESKVMQGKSEFWETYELMRLRTLTERSNLEVDALRAFIRHEQ